MDKQAIILVTILFQVHTQLQSLAIFRTSRDEDGAANGTIIDPLYIGVRSDSDQQSPPQTGGGSPVQPGGVLQDIATINHSPYPPNTGGKRLNAAGAYLLSIAWGAAFIIIGLGAAVSVRRR